MRNANVITIVKPALDRNSVGLLDRAVSTFRSALAKTVMDRGGSWESKIDGVARGLNSRVHKGIGAPPDEVEDNDALALALIEKINRNRIQKQKIKFVWLFDIVFKD